MENLKALLPNSIGALKTYNGIQSKWRGSRVAGAKARAIMNDLGAPEGSFLFFAKAVHNLPWDTVTKCAVAARELGRNKPAYFNKLVQQEFQRRGIK